MSNAIGSNRIIRLRTDKVRAFHPPNIPIRLQQITASMLREGWRGRPVLVYQNSNGWQAITGSHRLAAAANAGIKKVPCMIVPLSRHDIDGIQRELSEALADCHNTPPLFETLNKFEVSPEIIGLMTLDMMARPDPDYDPELYDWRSVGEFAIDMWRRGVDKWILPQASDMTPKVQGLD